MYYSLVFSSDPSVIGSQYPQIQKTTPNYDFSSSSSVYNVSRSFRTLPNVVPDFNGFVLPNRAILTDFLSNVFSYPNGFIVSERVKNILSKCTLQTHAFYPIVLYYKGLRIDSYFWFHIIYDLTDVVDYERSKFFIKKLHHDLGDVSVSSKSDFLKKREAIEQEYSGQNVTLWTKKVQFLSHANFDFFKIGMFDSRCFITDKTYYMFGCERVTGLEYCHLPDEINSFLL